MRLTIWGCRGSLPTPGPSTTRYGGNTTCVELRLTDDTLIVIDAGSGIRGLGKSLLSQVGVEELYLYLTHSHWDHLMGFPFFLPNYRAGTTVRVRGGPLAKAFLHEYLEQQMRPPYFPVSFRALQATFDFHLGDPQERAIGGCRVEPVRLDHPNGGYGFSFAEDGRRFVFLPDNELGGRHVEGVDRSAQVAFCRGADLLLHDAQYTDEEYPRRRGWGHSTAFAAVDLAVEAGVARLGLFHHDPDRTDEEVDAIERACVSRAERAGTGLRCFAVREGMALDV